VIKIVISTLGTASIGIFMNSVKSYRSSKPKLQVCQEQEKAPLCSPMRGPEHVWIDPHLHKLTRPKGRDRAKPNDYRTVLRKSNKELKAGPNNFKLAEWDLIPPISCPMETDQIPLPSQQETTRVDSNIHILVNSNTLQHYSKPL
jgi:hypothetical protein